ncbi:MAG: hypothetical protein ACRDZR_02230 [Acidimicrobiales bacterium]
MTNKTATPVAVTEAPTVTVVGEGTCKATWFSVVPGTMKATGATVTYPYVLAAGATLSDASSVWWVTWHTEPIDQSACAGDNLALKITLA